jgi:hypothetical protein
MAGKLLLGIVLIPFCIFALPTVINFSLSYLLARLWATHLIPRALIFLCLSFILALNVRIPGIIADAIHSRAQAPAWEIHKGIEINEGDTVFVQTTTDQIESKLEYFQPVSLGGNEGCMCFYFIHPQIEKDDFVEWLKGRGLVLSQRDGSDVPVRIVADIDKNDAHSSVNISIYFHKNKVAQYRDRIRRSFPFEHSDNVLVNTLISFSQDTIWSDVFTKDNALPHPVSQFLDQAIRIAASPTAVKTQYLGLTFKKNEPADVLLEEAPWHEPDTCSNRVRFETRWNDEDIARPYREFLQQGEPGGKDTIKMYRGREAGTNVVTVGQNGFEKHVFLKTQEVAKYVEAIPVKVICGEKFFVVLVQFIGVGGDLRKLKEKEEKLTFWALKYSYAGELVQVDTFKIIPAEKGPLVFKDFEIAAPDKSVLYMVYGEWPSRHEPNPKGKQFRLLGEVTSTFERKHI